MIKECKICKIPLNPSNSYYPKTTNLLCKKHEAERTKGNTKKYHTSAKGKKATSEASKRAYIKHKEKWIARAKARYAVKKGLIIKPKRCEVCNLVKPLQGHHEDYSKPLEVIWLCSGCHAEADRVREMAIKENTS